MVTKLGRNGHQEYALHFNLSLTNRYWIGHEHFINEDYDADDLLIQLDYHDETRKRLIKRNKKGTHKLFGILNLAENSGWIHSFPWYVTDCMFMLTQSSRWVFKWYEARTQNKWVKSWTNESFFRVCSSYHKFLISIISGMLQWLLVLCQLQCRVSPTRDNGQDQMLHQGLQYLAQ